MFRFQRVTFDSREPEVRSQKQDRFFTNDFGLQFSGRQVNNLYI